MLGRYPQLLIFLDAFIFGISTFLIWRSKIKIIRMTPPSAFIIFYFFYVLFGQIFFALFLNGFGGQGNILSQLLQYDKYLVDINILTFVFFLFFCAGIFFSTIIIKESTRTEGVEYNRIESPSCSFIVHLFIVVLILDFLLLLVFIHKYGLIIATGNVDDARYYAIEHGGFQFILPIFAYTNPFIGGICFWKLISSDKSHVYKRYKKVFMLSFILQSLSVITGFRNYLVVFILILLSIYGIKSSLKLSKILKIFSFSVLFVIFITFIKYGRQVIESPQILIVKLLHRFVFDSAYSLKIIFHIFEKKNFLLGSSYIWDLVAKLPGKQMTFQNFLSQEWGGTAYFMALAPTLPGELYANFGYFSLLIGFFIGLLLNLLSMLLTRKILRQSGMFSVFTYITLFVFSIRIVTVGIGGVYFLIIISFLLFFGIFSFSTILKKSLLSKV